MDKSPITPISKEVPSETAKADISSSTDATKSASTINSIIPAATLSPSEQIIRNRNKLIKMLDSLSKLRQQKSQQQQVTLDQVDERCPTCQLPKRRRLNENGADEEGADSSTSKDVTQNNQRDYNPRDTTSS